MRVKVSVRFRVSSLKKIGAKRGRNNYDRLRY